MMSWLSQECKDFRIVFIDKDLSNEQKVALKYAQNFASVLWPYKQMTYAVEDKNDVPKAKMTKVLKDTSELPNDKYEVSKLKSKLKSKSNVKKQKESSIKANVKIILEKPLQTYNPYLESNTIKNISQHKDSIENNKVDDKKEKGPIDFENVDAFGGYNVDKEDNNNDNKAKNDEEREEGEMW